MPTCAGRAVAPLEAPSGGEVAPVAGVGLPGRQGLPRFGVGHGGVDLGGGRAPSAGNAGSSGIRSCNVGLQWVREERLSDLKEDRLLASYTSRRLYSSQTQTALTSRFTRLRVRVAHDDAEQGEAAAER